jgi:C4-dicarboxylate transporter DctM subunit
MSVALRSMTAAPMLFFVFVSAVLAIAAGAAFGLSTGLFIALVAALFLLRQPLLLILAVATAYVHVFFATNSEVAYLIQDMWFTLDREVLLAIPMLPGR